MSLPIMLALGAAAIALLGSSSSAAAAAPRSPKPPAKPAAKAKAKPAAKAKAKPAGKVIQMPVTEIEVSISELDDIDAAAALAAAQLDNESPLSAPQPGNIPRPLPNGYDPIAARKGAGQLSAHLTRAGRAGYDRRQLGAWQTKAGLTPDRIYGGATRGALVYYGAADAPPAFFPPTQAIPYTPPEKRLTRGHPNSI